MKARTFCLLATIYLLSFQCLFCDSNLVFSDLFNQFKNSTFDNNKTFYVRDFFISREQAAMTLDSGIIYFTKPVFGKYCVAVFSGTGTFTLAPPVKIEQEQLEKFFKQKKMFTQFNSAFLIFADSTLYDIEKASTFSSAEPSNKAREVLDIGTKYLLERDRIELDWCITKAFLENQVNETLWSMINLNNNDPVIFRFNPYGNEEIQLSRCYGIIANKYRYDLICNFSTKHDICSVLNKDLVGNIRYIINCVLENKHDIKCSTEITFKVLADSMRWIQFSLGELMLIDSIVDNSNTRLIFHKSIESDVVWMKFGKWMKSNDSIKLKICYHGDIRRGGWYPGFASSQKRFFDITFTHPDDFILTGTGENISNDKATGVYITRWVTKYPCYDADFDFADYKIKELDDPEIGHIKTYYFSTDMFSGIFPNIKESYNLFCKIFGKPRKRLTTIIQSNNESSYPGTLLINFRANTVIAHQVSHLWWGSDVDYNSYRDVWLREAFAEYSSLIYVQAKNHENYQRHMKEFKETLLNIRSSFLNKRIDPGAITLGWRNETFSTSGDYNKMVYMKGAWVLHMIRYMMIDLKTLSESAFINLMTEYYKTFSEKLTTSCDFMKFVESKMGLEMGWFFDQWINGNKIPTYVFSYKVNELPDGKYNVKVRIKQKDVPTDFKMFIPVKVDFGNDKFSRIKIFITGEKAEFDLPVMPLKPKKVILNDLEAVLCNVDTESWD